MLSKEQSKANQHQYDFVDNERQYEALYTLLFSSVVLYCHAKSGPGQNPSTRTSLYRQPKVVWGQIMATKTGPPRTRFGSQNWSYLAKSGPRGGLVLATKSGPGPGFGSQKWSWEKQFW